MSIDQQIRSALAKRAAADKADRAAAAAAKQAQVEAQARRASHMAAMHRMRSAS